MNEFISRKAVYQFAKDQRKKETGAFSKGYNKGLRDMMAAVMNEDAIPSEDVRPVVRGHNEDGYTLFTCSVCKWSCFDTVPGDTEEYNFCPNCGADMRPRPKEET